MQGSVLKYNALPTMGKFHQSDAFYRGVMGPVRSGKSTGMSMEVMSRAMRQKVWNGVRRSRWAIVRNTYGQLRDTTLKTWMLWFPEEYFGTFKWQEMTHYVEFGDVKAEVMFRALDRPDDVAKLLSMELTGAWVNEAREVPKVIIDTLGDRVGQYPPSIQGGCTWRGVMMDTNPCDEDHWWYRMAEEERPGGWDFFRQPGGLRETKEGFEINPLGENFQNLNEKEYYYLNRIAGKTKDYIRVYYCGEYGFVIDGKPVIPEYIDSVHCSQELLEPSKAFTVYVGLDFGLTPAALFTQRLPNGRWLWFDELCAQDMGISRFADILGPKLRGEYRDFKIEVWGDPAGEQRSQTDEQTPYQILEAKRIMANAAPTNDFTLRREAIAVSLGRLIDGKPGLIISPKCKMARKGLAGGYHYRRVQIAGQERYHDKPEKGMYSHPVEAGGYAMMGAGEGDSLIQSESDARVVIPGTVPLGVLSGMVQSGGWLRA